MYILTLRHMLFPSLCLTLCVSICFAPNRLLFEFGENKQLGFFLLPWQKKKKKKKDKIKDRQTPFFPLHSDYRAIV